MRNRTKISVSCLACLKPYLKRKDTIKNWNGMCRLCTSKYVISKFIKGIIRVPKNKCFNCRMEVNYRDSNRCKKCWMSFNSGVNHYKWKFDRTTLAKKQERGDSSYRDWRHNVWNRDGYKCKIGIDCMGRIEAHHILSWSKYPNLRYDVNNGITLCHKHHPRKRSDEKLLEPLFIKLLK